MSAAAREPSASRLLWSSVAAISRLVPRRRERVLMWLWTLLIGALLPIAANVALAIAIDAAPGVASSGLDSTDGRRLIGATCYFAVWFAFQPAFTGVAAAHLRHVGRRIDASLRLRVMAAATGPSGVAHLDDPAFRDALDAARNVAPLGFTPGSTVENLPFAVGSRLRSLGNVVVLLVLWWPLGLVALVSTVFVDRQMTRTSRRLAGTASRGALDVSVPNYHRDVAVDLGPAKEVRVFALGGWLRERFDSTLSVARAASPGTPRIFDGRLLAALAFQGGMTLAGLLWAGFAARRGDLDAGGLTLVLMTMLALRPEMPFMDFVVCAGAGAVGKMEAAEQLAAQLARGRQAGIDAGGHPSASIRFEGVSFRYPGSDVEVLRNVDLELTPGRSVALVGVNGAGKTTLVKLLCGLYAPTSGRILVDGIDLADLDPVSWRRQLAVLFQDFLRFELPMRDSVRFGAVHADADDERLSRAAALVGADRLLSRLPDGWDTTLSAGYLGGVDLSGGEWQRVALARAMLAIDAGARILVLDEPTANLDVRGEAEIYRATSALTSSGRVGDAEELTTLLISHRLSTVRHAHRILVMADGGIAEQGTHDELVVAGGRYAAMFDAQAAAYRDDGGTDPAEQTDLTEEVQ